MVFIVLSQCSDDTARIEGCRSLRGDALSVAFDVMDEIDNILDATDHEKKEWTNVGDTWCNGFMRVYIQSHELV